MIDNPNMDENIVYEQIVKYLHETDEMYYEAHQVQTVNDLFKHAMQQNDFSTLLLIEFLWREKKVIQLGDPLSALDLYYKPNNRKKLGELLSEYEASGRAAITLSHKASI